MLCYFADFHHRRHLHCVGSPVAFHSPIQRENNVRRHRRSGELLHFGTTIHSQMYIWMAHVCRHRRTNSAAFIFYKMCIERNDMELAFALIQCVLIELPLPAFVRNDLKTLLHFCLLLFRDRCIFNWKILDHRFTEKSATATATRKPSFGKQCKIKQIPLCL